MAKRMIKNASYEGERPLFASGPEENTPRGNPP